MEGREKPWARSRGSGDGDGEEERTPGRRRILVHCGWMGAVLVWAFWQLP